MTDVELMRLAIEMAKQSKPDDPTTVPRVGAVIAVDGTVISTGFRETNHHAEYVALGKARERSDLPKAAVYTTLEPCTPGVRSTPGESCLELLIQAQVKKVVIGILDPNQHVCGKGILELQNHGVEVSLFPHDLAQEIRQLNQEFIRAQQHSLGIKIDGPAPDAEIRKPTVEGRDWKCVVSGTFINPPGGNVFAIEQRGASWWPQRGPIRVNRDEHRWEVDTYFGTSGDYTIHIVSGTDLGIALMHYYWKVVDLNRERSRLASTEMAAGKIEPSDELRALLQYNYPAIEMTSLPKGLRSEARIAIRVVQA